MLEVDHHRVVPGGLRDPHHVRRAARADGEHQHRVTAAQPVEERVHRACAPCNPKNRSIRPGWAAISAAVPLRATVPAVSTVACVATERPNRTFCSTIRIVVPAAIIARTLSPMIARLAGSRP